MTSRERVEATLAFQSPDKVPICHIGISSGLASALLGREAFVGGGVQQWREATALWNGPDAHAEFIERSYRDAVDVGIALDNDILRVSYWRLPERPTRKIDDYTFAYENGPKSNWRILSYDPPSEQAHLAHVFPQEQSDDLDAEVEAAEASLTDYTPDPASWASEFRAMEEYGREYVIRGHACYLWLPRDGSAWLMASIERPDLVGRMMDVSVEKAELDVPFLAARGFRNIFGGNDFCSAQGPFFSPSFFREHVKPRVRRIAAICREHGCAFFFASDGNLWPVADDLFGEGGADGYFEIDLSAGMALPELRSRFPRLKLVGNIRSQVIHLGTRKEIETEAITCLDAARNGGGIVAGASNYFVPGTPIENLEWLLEVIRKNR